MDKGEKMNDRDRIKMIIDELEVIILYSNSLDVTTEITFAIDRLNNALEYLNNEEDGKL